MQEIEKRNKELLEEIEKLKRQNKTLKSRKKYGLVWEEEKEPEQIVLDCQIKIPLLKQIKSKEIISDKEKAVNVLIEGDNYHALSVLNYTHKKKIDVIYIDPPYNTGKGFIFNDKIVDSDDSFRHSKWLSFMSKRLKLAKDLLKSDGLIFISINDIELAQLKILCDEIFDEENFIANLVWENKEGGGSSDSKHFKIKHEYILVYAKDKKELLIKAVDIEDEDRYSLKDEHEKERGKYQLIKLNSASIQYSQSLDYPIEAPDKSKILPSYGSKRACWRWSKKKLEWGIKNDFVVIKKGQDGNWAVYTKQYLKVDNEGNLLERDKRPIGVISNYSTTMANKQLEGLFGKKVFDYSKPYLLVKYLIERHPNKNAMVLDFFAGSGTTAQSVLELNKDDDGKRRFILCTNNENNNGTGLKIATDVCYPRIKKVIDVYTDNKGNKLEGYKDNLRYFKTELLDIDHISHVSDEQKIKLTYQAGDMIALREGTFEEVEKDEWWQIYKDGTKYTAIYFKEDKRKLNELVKKLSKLKEKVILYIFSWGKNEYKNEFTEYKNIKVEDIPEPIIDVYKEVNRLS